MYFSRRPVARRELQPHHGADSMRVLVRTAQSDTQAGFTSEIVKEPGLLAILAHHEVRSPVFIKITDCGATLLSINFHPTFLARHGSESAFAIPLQP